MKPLSIFVVALVLLTTFCFAQDASEKVDLNKSSLDKADTNQVDENKVDFNKQIKPLLAEHCFACHGMDAESRKADLRLDQAGAAVDAGAIVAGKPDESSLVERLFSDDADLVMPPPATNKPLSDSQKELLKRWVSQGAQYEKHWSLIAPTKPALPKVKTEGWARNEIDLFVLSRLEKEGLTPNPSVGLEKLYRRLSLDITGLPPDVDEMQSFISAYGEWGSREMLSDAIDKLMEKPTWGEHRARYWLDAARYADTHGMHYDNYREMWPYRDWVIKSFNANQPFDQFTIEQLAGDLLENPTQEQLIATGFQRCNMTTNEGGTIDEENLAIYAADRVQTFGWVYLGLTTNCCQCHDHKFDPISTKDYYSLAAYFRNTTQKAKDGNAKDGLGPTIVVPTEADAPRWKLLPTEIAAAKEKKDQRKKAVEPAFAKWLSQLKADDVGSLTTDKLVLHLPLNEGIGNIVAAEFPITKPDPKSGHDESQEKATETDGEKNSVEKDASKNGASENDAFENDAPEKEGEKESDDPNEDRLTFAGSADLKWEGDGVIGPALKFSKNNTIELGDYGDFSFSKPYTVGCWVKATGKGSGAIVGKMKNENAYRGWDVWQNGGEFATHLIDKWTENGSKVVTKGNRVKPNTWQHLVVTYDGSETSEGLKIFIDGKLADTRFEVKNLKKGSDTHTQTPLALGRRSTGQYPFNGWIQDFILYDRKLAPEEIASIASAGPIRVAAETPAEERSEELTKTLRDYYLRTHDSEFKELDKQLVMLESELESIKRRSPVTHVQVEKSGVPMANILMRGAYDKKGEQVTAAPLSALHPMPAGVPNNRLGLAKWVVDRNNPLTARVTVNRVWQELFGQGIVATSEDFGIMGTPPANQELLDWLAVDFQESGWDVKRLYKKILMSATYQQSAITSPEKLLKDRDNSLLSRGPRFRMDAEMVRDYALSSSGLLSKKMYGPGAKPYQPGNLWEIVGLPGGDTRKYVQGKGEDLHRRSVYSFWKRMSPPPNLEAFDAPKREVCSVRRDRTNTPLQALVTLNDPQFFEAARVLAQNAMKAGDGDALETLKFIGLRTVSRQFVLKERAIINASRKEFAEHYAENKKAAKALVAFGETPTDESLDVVELAAWTMVCNQVLNLDEVLNK